MITHSDTRSGHFTHQCGNAKCGYVRRSLDMARDVRVSEDDLAVICPLCNTSDHWNHEVIAHYQRLMTTQHPDSLVGTIMPDTKGIVVEDSRYEVAPHTAEDVRHALSLHAHPAITAQRQAARRAAHLPDLFSQPQE